MSGVEAHVETKGDVHAVGFRNELRARWRAQSQERRWMIIGGTELALAILFGLLDVSLGLAIAVVAAMFWLPKLAPVPWRLAVETAIVALCAVLAATGHTEWSLPIVLLVGFALFWVPRRHRAWVAPVTVLVAVVAYPFFVQRMFTMPMFGVFPDVSTGVYMVVFVMMAVGLNIVVGYAGLLDLGYVAFYATGAYTAAWFASLQFSNRSIHFGAVGLNPPNVAGIHITIWLLLLLAGVFTALCGVVIGLPTLRLRGDYLAIVTLGFGEIVYVLARNGDHFGGFNLTNGPNGITPIDSPGWGNTLSRWTGGFLPANYLLCCKANLLGHQLISQDVFFWTAIVLLIFTVFCSIRLRDSRLGRAWVAIREDETAAAAMG